MNLGNMFSQIRKVITLTKIKPLTLAAIGLLSFGAALFEGASIGLLIPTLKGIINMDFTFVRELPIAKDIINYFPYLFVTKNSSIFIMLIASIVAAGLMKNALLYLSNVMLSFRVRDGSDLLRKAIFNRYLTFGKSFFDNNNQGYLSAVMTAFIGALSSQVLQVHTVLVSIFMLLVYLSMAFSISWQLTAAIIFFAPSLYYLSRWLMVRIEKTSYHEVDAQRRLNEYIFGILSCMPLIKLYSNDAEEKAKFAYMSEAVRNWEKSMSKKKILLGPLNESIILIGLTFLITAAAVVIVRGRVIDIAPFMIYFFLIRRTVYCYTPLSSFIASFASAKGYFSEVFKMLSDEGKVFIEEGEEEFAEFKDKIEFRNLNFSYIKGIDILHDINLSIEKGKMTAIVGPTGTGKSTIINLILRFYNCPPSSLLIDGKDIREFTLTSLAGKMAFVGQDPLLFNDTIAENMKYGMRQATMEDLIEAAKKARLYDFIMSLPNKFNTLIGDRGIKLSGGEKQRLSIARALLKKSEILLLDEATSSLDSKTERLIQEAIEETVKGRTTIVIAHRLSTIKNADQIFVIENGRAIEKGALRELLDKRGKFYQYWEEQKFY